MKKYYDFIMINIGLLLVAVGIYLFKIPNKFVTGGVSGIAIIIGRLFPGISVGFVMLVINVLLLALGLMFMGFDFASRSVYSSFVLAGMVWAFERIYPMTRPLVGDAMLELIFAILLPALGSAIIFNHNASTGGTDIVARILSKMTHVHIGKTLLIADFATTVIAAFVFGIRIGMYSILGLILRGFLIDLVIESMNISKQVVIVSGKPEKIKDYIVNTLHRGATIYKAMGAFTNEEKEVISTIVNRKEAIRLRNFVRSVDDKSFITITNASEIIGRGFRNTDL